MRFKLDENMPLELLDLLAAEGYEADDVPSEGLQGAKDLAIGKTCRRESRIIVTFDLHFADIRAFPPLEYPGIIVLRLRLQDTDSVLSVFRSLLPKLPAEPIEGRLWIVDEKSIRIRPSPTDMDV